MGNNRNGNWKERENEEEEMDVTWAERIRKCLSWCLYLYRDQGEADQVWEINTGNNRNMKGYQRSGNIKAPKSAIESSSADNLAKRSRVFVNSGSNWNEGDMQVSGNIDFPNVG